MTDQPVVSQTVEEAVMDAPADALPTTPTAELDADNTANAADVGADVSVNASVEAGGETSDDVSAGSSGDSSTEDANAASGNADEGSAASENGSAEPVATAAETTTSAAPLATRIEDLRVGQALDGRVRRVALFGAFVDVGAGIDGLLHISQLGRNVRNVEDAVKVGDQMTVYVMKVDPAQRRIALSLTQPTALPWEQLQVGETVKGKIVKVEQYGAFVDIGAERPGMIHVSELAQGYVNSPSDVVKVGDEIEARVIKVNPKQRRIDLSIKALQAPPEVDRSQMDTTNQDEEEAPTAMAVALRRAMQPSSDDLADLSRGAPSRGGDEFDYGSGSKGERKRDKGRDRDRRQQRDMEDLFERTLRGNRR